MGPGEGISGLPHRAYGGEYLANIQAAVSDPEHPTQIGPYLIEQLIGEGGMGNKPVSGALVGSVVR